MAKRTVRLTESDMTRLIKRVVKEQQEQRGGSYPKFSARKIKDTYGESFGSKIESVVVDKFEKKIQFDMEDGTQFSFGCD